MWRRWLGAPGVAAALLVLLLLSLSLHLWGLRLFGGSLDYQKAGTWGEMVAGIGQALAVIVAVRSFASEARRLDEERRRLHVAALKNVHTWLEPRLDSANGHRVWLLRFENQTRHPVYKWAVHLTGSKDSRLDGSRFGPIRPGGSEIKLAFLGNVDPAQAPRVIFEFVDAEGEAWRRSPGGGEEPIALGAIEDVD